VGAAGILNAAGRLGDQEVPDPTPAGAGCHAHPVDPALGAHGLREPAQAIGIARHEEHVETLGPLVSGGLTHLGEGAEAVHRWPSRSMTHRPRRCGNPRRHPRTCGIAGRRRWDGPSRRPGVRLEALGAKRAPAPGRRRPARRPRGVGETPEQGREGRGAGRRSPSGAQRRGRSGKGRADMWPRCRAGHRGLIPLLGRSTFTSHPGRRFRVRGAVPRPGPARPGGPASTANRESGCACVMATPLL